MMAKPLEEPVFERPLYISNSRIVPEEESLVLTVISDE